MMYGTEYSKCRTFSCVIKPYHDGVHVITVYLDKMLCYVVYLLFIIKLAPHNPVFKRVMIIVVYFFDKKILISIHLLTC